MEGLIYGQNVDNKGLIRTLLRKCAKNIIVKIEFETNIRINKGISFRNNM